VAQEYSDLSAAAADLPKSLQTMPLRFRQRRSFAVPLDAPPGLLNSWSIRLFNSFYYRLNRPTEQ
jgi:hypothetical protein